MGPQPVQLWDNVIHLDQLYKDAFLKKIVREEPLMIWGGGARAKAVKKNSTATRPGKKNSTAGWPGKKTQRKFSARGPPPDH